MATAVYDSINIESLSDVRLGECLKSYGYLSPGPITSSTRNVYRRKLQGLVERSGSSNLNGPFTTPASFCASSPKNVRGRGKRGKAKSRNGSDTSFGSPQDGAQSDAEDSRSKISKIESPSTPKKIENSNPIHRSSSSSPRMENRFAQDSSSDPFFPVYLEGHEENSLHNQSYGSSSSSSRSDHSLDTRPIRGSPPSDVSPPATSYIPGCSIYLSSADQQWGLTRDLLGTLNKAKFVGSDVCFQTSHGDRLFASRAVLAARCPSMIPYLYSTEVAVPLKVMTLTGQMCVVWARPSDLVANVKYRIFFQQGIHMKAQRLVYDQTEMLDHMPLSSFGICVASTIHLLISSEAAPSNEIPNVEQSLQSCHEETPTPPSLVSQSSIPIGLKSPINSFKKEMIRDAMNSINTSDSQDSEGEDALPFHVEHVVYLPGVDHACTQAFLRYLYSDCIELSLPQVVQVTALAHTFSIQHLKGQCLEYLTKCLDQPHLLEILQEAERFGCDEIREICNQFAKKNGIKIEERVEQTMVTENLSRLHLT